MRVSVDLICDVTGVVNANTTWDPSSAAAILTSAERGLSLGDKYRQKVEERYYRST